MNDFPCVPLEGSDAGLRLEGELDIATVKALRDALSKLEGDGGVTLDFADLTFIDSCGIQAIAEFAQNGASSVRIENADPIVSRMLQLMGLDGHPSLEVTRRDGGV